MNRIKEVKKPPSSLVKLIESVGILLLIPMTKKKSNYKVPLPSNYDDTLDALYHQYDECIIKINQLESSLIENDTASLLFNKILDPSFIYEDVINIGGLIARDLFNCCLQLLQKLQQDISRIPILIHNMIVLVDGSRASMVALDTATHICKHGTLHILADNMLMDINNPETSPLVQENMHLLKMDIHRRCKSYYKLPDHCFQIHDRLVYYQDSPLPTSPNNNIQRPFGTTNPKGSGGVEIEISSSPTSPMLSPSGGSNLLGVGKSIWNSQLLNQQLILIKQSLSDLSEIYDCQTLIIGLQNSYDFQLSSKESLSYWSVWEYPGDTIITKGISYHRPFTEVSTPRTLLLYIDPNHYDNSPELIKQVFIKALRYYRTGDTVIVLSMFLSSDPIGDNRETRYEFGQRHLWLKDDEYMIKKEANCINWNENRINDYRQLIQQSIAQSFLNGKVRIERYHRSMNVIQMITMIALQENVQGIIMTKDKNEEIIGQCIRDHPYSLFLLK